MFRVSVQSVDSPDVTCTHQVTTQIAQSISGFYVRKFGLMPTMNELIYHTLCCSFITAFVVHSSQRLLFIHHNLCCSFVLFCLLFSGRVPKIVFNGDTESTFVYIRVHFEYMFVVPVYQLVQVKRAPSPLSHDVYHCPTIELKNC